MGITHLQKMGLRVAAGVVAGASLVNVAVAGGPPGAPKPAADPSLSQLADASHSTFHLPATVRPGDRGPTVRLLQSDLNLAGYNVGAVDGVDGRRTTAEVVAFQSQHSLARDGIAGPRTWVALEAADAKVKPTPRPPPNRAAPGVDVSEWQGRINWSAVKRSGRTFAYSRLSYGGREDFDFARNWPGMKQAGLDRGFYIYALPGQGAREANLVARVVGREGRGDLPAAIDVEEAGISSSELRTLSARLQQITGKRPVIYTAPGLYNSWYRTNFGDRLWDADISNRSQPRLPIAWNSYVIRQNGWHGRVPGISGEVDTDTVNGGTNALSALAG